MRKRLLSYWCAASSLPICLNVTTTLHCTITVCVRVCVCACVCVCARVWGFHPYWNAFIQVVSQVCRSPASNLKQMVRGRSDINKDIQCSLNCEVTRYVVQVSVCVCVCVCVCACILSFLGKILKGRSWIVKQKNNFLADSVCESEWIDTRREADRERVLPLPSLPNEFLIFQIERSDNDSCRETVKMFLQMSRCGQTLSCKFTFLDS